MAEEIKTGETLTPTPNQEKTFTQAEVNSMIESRVARMKEGKEHEEAMQSANERYETLAKENEVSKQELTKLRESNSKRDNLEVISKLGADPEFSDYIYSKVDKGESPEQYAQNIQTFLEANPKFKAEKFARINSNPSLDGNGEVMVTNESLKNMTVKEIQELVKAGKL